MSSSGVLRYLDRFLPDTAARLYLREITIDIDENRHPLFCSITKLQSLVYFNLTGEVWMLHQQFSYKGVVNPFVLPLLYQYCADYHLIVTLASHFENYPKEVTQLWKRYGYGVLVIDPKIEPPMKLIEYPLTQFMFPEVRQQVHAYIEQQNGIKLFRRPFWITDDLKPELFTPAPELMNIVKKIDTGENEEERTSKGVVKTQDQENEKDLKLRPESKMENEEDTEQQAGETSPQPKLDIPEPKSLPKELLSKLPKKEVDRVPRGIIKNKLANINQTNSNKEPNSLIKTLLEKAGFSTIPAIKIFAVSISGLLRNKVPLETIMEEIERCLETSYPDPAQFPVLTQILDSSMQKPMTSRGMIEQ